MGTLTLSPKGAGLLSCSRSSSSTNTRKNSLHSSGWRTNCRITPRGAVRLLGSFEKVDNIQDDKTKKCVILCCSATSSEVSWVESTQDDYMVREFGWGVRRMVEDLDEMGRTSYVQAEAFHIPVAFFNDQLFKFFQAEVLSALMYRIKNSPPNRYACLVAEPINPEILEKESRQNIVGVVDVTAQNDGDVLKHLDGALEYLYVSGIAVLRNYRRRKVGSALLKACEELSILWGFKYLVLRAYEDDLAALKLYTGNGYIVVSADPKWTSTWIGRRRRVLMAKRIFLS